MTRHSRCLVLLAAIAAGLLPAAVARAQSYGAAAPPTLYPYETQRSQPYAVQVAPNIYVIQRPEQSGHEPRMHRLNRDRHRQAVAAPTKHRFDRPHKPVDHALVEELRERSHGKAATAEPAKKDVADDKTKKRAVTGTTKIVRDPPVVVEHKRYVDDPPRVVERRNVVEDEPARAKCNRGLVQHCDNAGRAAGEETKHRVINAEAEITILGPDRMSIRLFRKRHGPDDKGLNGE